jgi:hypothetical protein
MKKQANKLVVRREIVRELKSSLADVAGGIPTPTASRLCPSAALEKCLTTI